MRLTYEVFQSQQQKLLMTPELHQAIAILQMSTLELTDYIQRELEENPFLEEKEDPVDDKDSIDYFKLQEWVDYYNSRELNLANKDNGEDRSVENFLVRRPSLYEHLEFQMRLESKKPDDMLIGNYLIGSIDGNGYLNVDLAEVAGKIKVSRKRVEEVLKVIQSFHPYGVGARNLAECLLLQLKHYGKENELATIIIEKHLSDLARGNLNKIAQSLSVPVCKIQEICDLIRTLDPRPGRQYTDNDSVRYILPDIFVENVNGEYLVVINDFHFPHLIINNVYEAIMRQTNNSFSHDTKKYLENKMGAAIWLIRSIEQRRMTLYKVARCIVDIQKDFLAKGIEYLKPLKLKEVADIVDVHESTVSRAANNKYVQTPQGLFELKYFFSSGINSYYGNEAVSSKSIKYMVEEIIAGEDATKPLSDQAIAKILAKRGIRISRRTVAKYRGELGILSTMARKRYKN